MIGAAALFRGQTISRAYQKARFPDTMIPPGAEQLCKFGGPPIFAGFIQCDNSRFAADFGMLAALIGQFADRHAPADPFLVTINKLLFRAAADFPTRDNMQFHGRSSLSFGSLSPAFIAAFITGTFANGPHAFKIIECTDFGTKEMDDNVARINQDPISVGESLYPGLST